MDEKEIDLKGLSDVKTLDFFPSPLYKYLPEIARDGVVTRKRIIKYKNSRKYYGEECPENHTIINGVICENPEVILCFIKGEWKRYFFKSYAEAKEFEAKILKLAKHIRI